MFLKYYVEENFFSKSSNIKIVFVLSYFMYFTAVMVAFMPSNVAVTLQASFMGLFTVFPDLVANKTSETSGDKFLYLLSVD